MTKPMASRSLLRRACCVILAIAGAGPMSAEEGMWLFTRPPRAAIAQKYGVELSDAWLERLQKSSVGVGTGSGAFVSPDGLVLTNHHVARECIAQLSTPTRDYLRDGFHARTRAAEKVCPGLTVDVLMAVEDVTDRVKAAVTTGMAPAEAEAARRAVIATIEKNASAQPGRRGDVVTLYGGGEYHLYSYKPYTDVRLVFAPEEAVAFFGGDPDNFEYPRFCLDVSFLRAYESGRPAHTEHFLRVNHHELKEGDVVFTAGHPGVTNRQETVAQFIAQRDAQLPFTVALMRRDEVMFNAFAKRSAENARQVNADLKDIENVRKVYEGMLDGLRDPALLARRQEDERRLREAARAGAVRADPWDAVAAVVALQRQHRPAFFLLEVGPGFLTPLLGNARALLRLADESNKPETERLPGFGNAQLDAMRRELTADTPAYLELERLKLARWLNVWAELLPDDPLLAAVLDGQSPKVRAAALINGSRIHDVGFRRAMLEGGAAAIAGSPDTLLRLARQIDARGRELRSLWARDVEEPLRVAQADIAAVRFAVDGNSVYPDATSTLRLSFGTVKGHKDSAASFPWTTRLGGLFERETAHEGIEPYRLPVRWRRARARLDAATPFNFVSTNDLTGGSSGSPVVNRAGEYVGTVFDGNSDTLAYSYAYSEGPARAVNVHVAAVVEALRGVYGATTLLAELGVKARPGPSAVTGAKPAGPSGSDLR
jgi:hypothetical protein